MKDITKTKNADNLSTLKENERRGSEEAALYEKEWLKNKTETAETSPEAEPRTASELPQILAAESFFLKSKEPSAPAANRRSEPKKAF